MKLKFAKLISTITVVPVMAFITITGIYLYSTSTFNNEFIWFIITFTFLSFIPITAYVLKGIMPNYKNKGREVERELAFKMALIGYTMGIIVAKVFNSPKGVVSILFVYFISSIVLTIENKVLMIKASGHACGAASSLFLLLYYFGFSIWYAVLLLPIIYWARLTQKRHTFTELIIGTLTGLLSGLIALTI